MEKQRKSLFDKKMSSVLNVKRRLYAQINHRLILQLTSLAMLLLIPSRLLATDKVVQRQFGKQMVTIKANEEITYYDFKEGKGFTDSYLNNTQSLTVFKPATSGAVIQITFERFDVQSDGQGWPGYVNIYNGIADADNSFSWASSVYDVTENPSICGGDIMEKMDGTYTNKTFTSTSTDGCLSVGMLWKRGKAGKGWVAKVRCIEPQTMEVKDAGEYYSNVVVNPRTKDNILLTNFYIETEGENNADRLTAINVTLPDNENVINPQSIKVYLKENIDADGAMLINSTVTEDGSGYKINLNQTLEKGNNTFAILCDFLDDGTIGGKVSIDITRLITLKCPDGIAPFEKKDPVAVHCPGIILIATNDTIVVGDYPLDFFDDGGLNGNISPYFEGRVTFIPETAGKKVQIDFSKVRLFVAGQYGNYGQYIKVYNGMNTDEDNFLMEVKNYQQPIVKSSSEDGALTVTFLSTVSSANSEGFEAKVSQIVPEPMTIDEIKVSQYVKDVVSPGDINQPVIYWNIKTKENGNALSAEQFFFTTNGTDAPITKASLYYGRMLNEFEKAKKIGEITVSDTNIDLTTEEPVRLIEGDNYFWLTFDIDENALNGQRIDAQLLSFIVDGNTHTVNEGDPYGNRMVKHTVYSHKEQGIVVSVVNDFLTFKNKPFLGELEYYEFGKDDRINIFVPKHENMRCQIDFSKFVLYWKDGDEPVKASFKIYSGYGVESELLWEAKTSSDIENGPNTPISSKSEDGALTIVFNSDAKKFAHTGKGFEAIVREYDPIAPVIEAKNTLADLGTEITLEAKVKDGTKPYNIVWMNGKHQVLSEETTNAETLTFRHVPTECDDYLVKVTDANGKTAIDTCRVIVMGEAITATFENLYLTPESYNDGERLPGSFVSGTYLFNNTCVPEMNYWYGCSFSNRTSILFENIRTDQFNSAAGAGYNGSNNYVVCYPQGTAIEILNDFEDNIKGFYVTNNAWVIDAIRNGDGYTEGGFRKGDYLRLNVKGIDSFGEEKSFDYFLADYRAEKEEDHYYLDTWQWVDMSELGKMKKIVFTMGSTRGNLYGMTTPSYFCIDNFNGERQITEVQLEANSSLVDISQYFSFDHPTATIKYTIDDKNTSFSLSETGILNTNGQKDVSVIIRAIQRGKIQFIRLNIGNTSSIGNTPPSKATIKAIYTAEGKRLTKLQRGLNIVKMSDGSFRKIIK